MTKLEALEQDVRNIRQVLEELVMAFYNFGSIEQLKADLDNIAQLPDKERQLAIENLYNNCVAPLEKMYLDIEAMKGKITEDAMKDLQKYIKKHEIKVSYN